ncbi:hypothetical protein [Photobacterium angustum]|uniref:hypothetical protein n=1 Tax=Photobacterium angustum TaxID=661 RepID=UPI000D16FA14|nr:hypothetical protein [Photobacterium angustum]PSW76158.1 hypothetical protein CTN03_22345 [Photobacterium angustum]
MKNVQCTFRLPQEVVDLIDKQSGKTRTDKLLNLLGHGSSQDDYTVIEKRFDEIENRLSLLESSSENKDQVKINQSNNQANELRSLEAKNRLFSALDELKSRDEIPLYRGKPSITKISEITGIDRGTISKYIKDWGAL